MRGLLGRIAQTLDTAVNAQMRTLSAARCIYAGGAFTAFANATTAAVTGATPPPADGAGSGAPDTSGDHVDFAVVLPTLTRASDLVQQCIGEYGAVLVVSNNLLGRTETAPLHVYNLITNDQDKNGAYAVAFVLVMIAFAAILLSAYIRRRQVR